MITMGENGNIIINVNVHTYDLSSPEDYTELLLWLTSPDPTTPIDSNAFEIDPDASAESKEMLERYGSFLKTFVEKRESMIQEASTKPFPKREEEIKELLNRLAGE